MPSIHGVNSVVAQGMFLEVAKATVQKPAHVGGNTIAEQVGDHLADKLAVELAAMLADVMPAAVVETLSADLLHGADEIRKFTGLDRRSVYNLAQTSRIPVFRMGAVICARKSTLLRWIAEQEGRAA